MAEKKKEGWKNQVKASLPPKYRQLVTQYAELNEMPCSQAIKIMVRSFFDSMPKEQISKLQSKNTY
ncbi:hypothetical protein PV783_11590 [Chitinophaga sp. CC14]|uniref:hypothetical protein n=1 Tax=Chitinophaga sp. CC14 TaxID=3029199 RepID=UPI003B7C3BBC